jgi:deoxyribodipyrimidine photolyase
MWVGEVAWRDFYNHNLAAVPRVGMGQPDNPKYRGIQVRSLRCAEIAPRCLID